MSCCGETEGEFCYYEGAELPDAVVSWFEGGQLVDLPGPLSFEARIGREGQPAVVTKTSGITGAATAPNLTIQWDPGELDPLTPGRWTITIVAGGAGGRDRVMQAPFIYKWTVH